MIKNALFLITLLLIASSCSTVKESDVAVSELDVETLQKAVLFGAGEEGFKQEVKEIKSIAEWEKAETQLSKINPFTTTFDINSIDFSTHSLFLITDEVRSTGGYSLTAKNATRTKGEGYIEISIITPILPQTDVLTQQVMIILTEKKSNVIFRFVIEM